MFDTNIVMDLLLDRIPFSAAAAQLFSKVEKGIVEGYLCATTITTIHYLLIKVLGKGLAAKEIQKLLQLFEIAPINRSVLEKALESGFEDYEDAVIYAAGCHVEANGILTRNVKDFRKAKIPIYSSEELLKILSS